MRIWFQPTCSSIDTYILGQPGRLRVLLVEGSDLNDEDLIRKEIMRDALLKKASHLVKKERRKAKQKWSKLRREAEREMEAEFGGGSSLPRIGKIVERMKIYYSLYRREREEEEGTI